MQESTNGSIPSNAIGTMLRAERERQGLAVSDVSARINLTPRIIEQLERLQPGADGLDVFTRGQVRSYAKLLGLDLDAHLQAAPVQPPVQLVTRQHTPRMRHFAEQLARRAVYVVITLAVGVPIYLAATRSPVAGIAPATVSLEKPVPAPVVAPAEVASKPTVAMASIVPVPAATQPVAPVAGAVPLHLVFDQDSWVQFSGADGSVAEKGLIKAGESRNLDPAQVSRVKFGNASHVRVERDGHPVDVAAFIRSDVARFAVSSTGVPEAAAN